MDPAKLKQLHEMALAYFQPQEGRSPWAYLDTVGLVTIGIGHMVPSADEMAQLPLVIKHSSVSVSAEQKKAEWYEIKAKRPGNIYTYYEPFCRLYLPWSEVDNLFFQDCDKFIGILERRIPGYGEFPEPAQLALLDLIFSMGEGRLFPNPSAPGYPNLLKAVAAGNWYREGDPTCAAEHCTRRGVAQRRNEALRQLFVAAAKSEVKA